MQMIASLVNSVAILAFGTLPPEQPPIEYNRDVRPILSENCFRCHGPDARQRKAGLRLDVEAGAKTQLKSGATAIVSGAIGRSELVARVLSSDSAVRMPPPESGKNLSPRQVDTLKKWIDAGAEWQGHWSLVPVNRAEPPKVFDAAFVKNPIDAFVLDAIARQGLRHSAEAERVTLIRRLSFDLIGLPPTPEDVERFVAEADPRAYEQLVERLLASPHFGERMATFWLDLVRYADSVGYHGDQPVSVWPFRDYVINSFNANKPFDQFTIEQLAGDLLPDATIDQRVASGYNRLGMMSAEGGVQDREYLAKYAAERVRNVAGAWLGVTLGCCECHDHKFDPFTSRDFYRMAAFFADVKERGVYLNANADGNWGPKMQLPTPEQSTEMTRLDAAIAETRADYERATPEIVAAQAEWERSIMSSGPWMPFRIVSATAANKTSLAVQEDLSIRASDPSPPSDSYTIVATLPLDGVTAIRVEVLPDPSLPGGGPGRAANGNFVLTEIIARVQRSPDAKPQPLVLDRATASFEQAAAAERNPYKVWSAASAIDGDSKGATWGWAILPQAGRAHEAVFETVLDVAAGPDSLWTIELKQNHDNPQHTLGRFRLSATNAPRPVRAAGAGLPAGVRDALAVDSDKRSDQQKSLIAAHYRSIAPALKPLRDKLADLDKAKTTLDKQIATTLVTVAVPPRATRVLGRGNWMDESGAIVTPGVPAILECRPGAPGTTLSNGEKSSTTSDPVNSAEVSAESRSASSASGERTPNRFDLARAIVSPENPLTARVFVNRLWKQFFGAGLSTKLDDLGAQGDWPSHAELLDWLAGEFVQPVELETSRLEGQGGEHRADGSTVQPFNGSAPPWDVKHIIRLIVMSSTYRQSSVPTPELRERDPSNRWLARQGRWRLDAELVRDNALAVSGMLVTKIGGPSVKPYQPPGYWAYLNFPTREWQNGSGDDLYRRGLYTHWQRQYLHPSMAAFDAPCREECTADRVRSNTPLQSLVLLNDTIYVEAARVLAERVLRDGGATDAERLNWAFRQAVSRPAKSAEAEVLLELLHKHREHARANPDSAGAIVDVGARPPATDLDRAELAAWTSVTRAILNLHSTITRN